MAPPRLACAVAEAPITCPRCPSVVREDSEFTVHAHFYDLPQRRYVCPAGHSIYTGLTVEAVTWASPAIGRHRPTKSCRYCGTVFEAKTQTKFCSRACAKVREAERERARGLLRRQEPHLSGAELDRLRAIRLTPRRRVLVPYAPRPRGLSTAWV